MEKFDAAAKTADLVPDTVVIEGKEFTLKRSGRALKKLMEIDPGDEDISNAQAIEVLYQGLSFMLVDPAHDPEVSKIDDKGVWHPDPDWLEENMDYKVAQGLMEIIVPADRVEPPTPAASTLD